MYKRDIIGSLLFMAVFAAALAGAGEFPDEVAVYPRLICWAGLILGAVQIAKSWLAAKKESAPAENGSHTRAALVVVLTLAGSLVYIFSLEYVGYAVSTALFIMIFSYLFDNSARKIWYPVIGIAVTAVIYLLFSKALHIPLPQGMLF